MPQFLSEEWLEQAKAIRAEYEGQGGNPPHEMKMNLVITDVPVEVSDVPIKLWVKYMEDTMDRLKRALFNVPVDASFEEVDDPAQDKPAAPARLRSVTPPPSGETPLSAAE